MFRIVLMKCLDLEFVKTAEKSLKQAQSAKEVYAKSVIKKIYKIVEILQEKNGENEWNKPITQYLIWIKD